MVGEGAAFAKINLSVDILSKRDDGYHNMKMVMQSVSLCDRVTVECVPGEGVTAETGLAYIPGGERNIAVKTARAFFAYTGIDGYGARITIKKNIPICAGLGGGSTDGACVLRILDGLFGTRLGAERLEAIGGGIGSDIPFCLTGGTALAEGRGDILSELPPLPQCGIVICKPPFSCSTPELFGRIKCEKIRARPDTDGIVRALGSGDLRAVAQRAYNVFEDVLEREKREVDAVKDALLGCGAIGAAMTGSGSAVFGIFDDSGAARRAYDGVRKSRMECFLAEPVGRTEC